jgi:PAS domain S-box-containing protein
MKRIEQAGKFPIALIVIFLCFSAAIIIAGTMFGSYISKKIKHEAESDLSAIADLKMQQILLWQKNRMAEADLLSESPFYVNAAAKLIANPGNISLRMQMQERLNAQLKSQYWHDMILLDKEGRIVMTGGGQFSTIGDKTHELLDKARLQKQPLMSDFYFCDICKTVHLDIIIPLFNLNHDMEPTKGFVGYTIMRLDPNVFLYPLIQSWPTPSKSSETLLVKKDGQDVLFLNELRFKKDTSLKLRIPLNQRSLPAAVAIAGSSGVFDGLDYRGVRVISHLRSIPGTDWHMVTKVDYEEVFSDLKRQEVLVLIIILVLIGLTASLITAIFFAQRREHYKKLLVAETERKALIKHFDYLTKYANDIIILCDNNYRIVEVNEKALQDYGYNREEMLSMTSMELRSEEERSKFKQQYDEVLSQDGMVFETKHIRKDGSTFTVEVSARPMEIEGKKYIQGIIRDISERKQYELDLQERKEELEAANQELIASEEEIKAADEELRHQLDIIMKSEERFKSTLDNMMEGCQIIDFESRYVYLNDTAARHGRRSADELMGHKMSECYPGIERTKVYYALQRCLEEKEPARMQNEFVYPNGSKAWFELSIQPVPEGAFILSIDITDRKNAEQELLTSSNFLNSIIEQSPSPMWISDDKGNLIRLNKACCELLNIAESEVVGKYNIFKDNIVEEQGYMPLVKDVFEKGETINFELTYDSTKLGSIPLERRTKVFLDVTIFPVKNINGKITNAVIQHRDITARKKAEEALEKEKAYLQHLFDMAPEGIIVHDLQGNLLQANKVFLSMFGYESGEVLGEDIDGLIVPDEELEEAHQLTRDVSNGKYFNIETIRKRKDRSNFDVSIIGSPIVVEGQQIAVYAIYRDITSQKKAEEALKNERSLYMDLVTSQPAGVYRLRVKPTETWEEGKWAEKVGTNYKLEMVSDKFCQILGVTRDECEANATIVVDKIHPNDSDSFTVQNVKALKEFIPFSWEGRIVRQGQSVWVHFGSIPRKMENGDTVWTGILLDITENKKAEEQIIASLKEKEVLLKEIHHRVKNNLQIIASLLNLQTSYVKDEQYKKMFLESQNRVRSMSLVHEKLYKSKDLSGIDFSEYINSLMNDLYTSYGITQDDVELSTDILKERMPIDIAIPCGLIINELASNSFKYAFKQKGKKGRIFISLIKDKDGKYRLEVSDNGPGMGKDINLKKIRTLGLQLVDALVTQLDARVSITNKNGAKVVVEFKV